MVETSASSAGDRMYVKFQQMWCTPVDYSRCEVRQRRRLGCRPWTGGMWRRNVTTVEREALLTTSVIIHPGKTKDRDARAREATGRRYSQSPIVDAAVSHTQLLCCCTRASLRRPVASAAVTDRHPTSYRWQCPPVLTLCCLHVCYTPYQVFSATWARQVSRVIYIRTTGTRANSCTPVSCSILRPYKAVYVQCRPTFIWDVISLQQYQTQNCCTHTKTPVPGT